MNEHLRCTLHATVLVGIAAACAALLLVASCMPLIVRRPWGPPAHARGHVVQKAMVYHYYPDLEIYWSVASNEYAVPRGGTWVVVEVRPEVITAAHSHVVIETATPKPWLKHDYFKKKYPHGWGKGKRKK